MQVEYGLKNIQRVLLEILVDIDRVCRENDIKYTLFGGTLLGAIRHRGFIPWDDDVDICFERQEFEKFMTVYPIYGNKKYYMGTVFNPTTPAVIYPKPEILGEIPDIQLPGPWVSLFVFDSAPNSRLLAQVKIVVAKTLMGMLGKPIHYNRMSTRTKILFSLTELMGRPFGNKRIRKLHTIVSQWGNSSKNKNISIYNLYADSLKIKYPKEMLAEYIDVPFEKQSFMVMSGYDICLTKAYGDYMVPPPENQRKAKHL